MNSEIIFFLQIKRQLENEISVLKEHYNFLSKNYNHHELVRKYRNNTTNYSNLINNQSDLVKEINKYIYENCSHAWCDDSVELNNEYIKNIKYCTYCYSTKKDKDKD